MGFLAGCISDSLNREQTERWLQALKNQAPNYIKDDLEYYCSDQFSLLAPRKNLVIHRQYAVASLNEQAAGFLKSYAERYIERGSSSLNEQETAFSGVLIDTSRQKIKLLTDFVGLQHLYYARIKDGLVFGTTADIIISHPEVSSEISHQSIYDYVYFHHCPSPNTIYKQVKKLEGGQLLNFKNPDISLCYYWVPEFSEHRITPVKEAGKYLQELLIQVVKDSVSDSEETGAFLSGGLDSSSVAGALSHVFPGKANTFTIGFPVKGYDEIEYAQIAVRHFNTRTHEYYLTPEDTVAAILKIAAYYDEPFGNSSALATFYCAKMASENGIKVMLAGDGGDELFAGNERYAKQLLFNRYYQIPGLARTLLKTGLCHAPQALLQNKIIYKAKRYVEQAEISLPDRLQDYNFLNRHPAQDIFNAEFLESIDVNAPIQGLRDCYNRPKNASALNRMLYMDWKTTLHDNDLVKVNRMCEMAGVTVRYPLLDKKFIDLSCRIPSSDKLKGQQLRWFYKQAMRDFLPKQIINKSKHGFGLPFGIWLKDHQPLKELAYDSLNALKKRGFFRNEFIDHAIFMHQGLHASYYGELIWIFMMLENWFQEKEKNSKDSM